jgi:hypothetical protein
MMANNGFVAVNNNQARDVESVTGLSRRLLQENNQEGIKAYQGR